MIKHIKTYLIIILATTLAATAFSIEPSVSATKKQFLQKEATRFKMKMGVFLVLIEDGQVLLLRRYNTGIGDGKYVFPMGGVEDGETASEAVIREAKEEAGIDVHPEHMRAAHVMQQLYHMPDGDTFEQVNVFFVTNHYDGIPANMEPHKADDLRFFPVDSLPANTEPFIRDALTAILHDQSFSEHGFSQSGTTSA